MKACTRWWLDPNHRRPFCVEPLHVEHANECKRVNRTENVWLRFDLPWRASFGRLAFEDLQPFPALEAVVAAAAVLRLAMVEQVLEVTLQRVAVEPAVVSTLMKCLAPVSLREARRSDRALGSPEWSEARSIVARATETNRWSTLESRMEKSASIRCRLVSSFWNLFSICPLKVLKKCVVFRRNSLICSV